MMIRKQNCNTQPEKKEGQTQTLNEPSERSKNTRDIKFRKIRMKKQVSNWWKDLSLIAETGTGSDNGKLTK